MEDSLVLKPLSASGWGSWDEARLGWGYLFTMSVADRNPLYLICSQIMIVNQCNYNESNQL